MSAIAKRALLVFGLGISALSLWAAYDIAGRDHMLQLVCVAIGVLSLAATIYGVYRTLSGSRKGA